MPRASLLSVLLGLAIASPGCGERSLPGDLGESETSGTTDAGTTGNQTSGTTSGGTTSGGTSGTTSGGTTTAGTSGGGTTAEPMPIPDATYLFALETSLGPDLPLQYVLDIANAVATADGTTADFLFQPLSLNQGAVTPGVCVGAPLLYEDVLIDAEGNFVLDMGLVMVSGAANPVTGSDIEATLMLHGQLVPPDAMCGEVTGTLMSPLEYDLTGSTFAAIPLPDGCDTLMFPSPAYKCSML